MGSIAPLVAGPQGYGGGTLEHYRLIGANPSPYSVKMRAVLRYRRLPFVWELRNDANIAETEHLKPAVIPILQYPDGSFRNDSTPLIFDLEQRHPERRSVLPSDPGLSFLAYLLEDMADEWGVKLMFHHRFYYDARFVSSWIVSDRYPGQPEDRLDALVQALQDRQVGRMALVGSTEANRPVLEECYRRVLAIWERGLASGMTFFFGTRPSLADFGWFGQLLMCGTDPTASAIMRTEAPHLFPWLVRLDDASGIEGGWTGADGPVPEPAVEMLRLAGEVYLPFLRANADAAAAGRDTFGVELLGCPYEQGVFKYQVKCLEQLRRAFAELPPAARDRITPVLAETGCLKHLEAQRGLGDGATG